MWLTEVWATSVALILFDGLGVGVAVPVAVIVPAYAFLHIFHAISSIFPLVPGVSAIGRIIDTIGTSPTTRWTSRVDPVVGGVPAVVKGCPPMTVVKGDSSLFTKFIVP